MIKKYEVTYTWHSGECFGVMEDRKDIFEIEECSLKVVELFGHTNCSIGFLIDSCFFVGDCIFAGGNQKRAAKK